MLNGIAYIYRLKEKCTMLACQKLKRNMAYKYLKYIFEENELLWK